MASDMPITSHFPMRKRRALGLGLEGRREKRATTIEAKKRTERTPEARTKISLRRNKKHSPSDKSCHHPSKTPTRAQFPNALVRLRKTPRRLAAWGGGYASDSGPEITWDNNSPSPTKALEKANGDGLLASKDPEQLASILRKLSKNKVLNKEDATASNLFNSWMRRENTSSPRRSERLIGKGRQKKRSVLNLAKPPEVAPEQRLTRKRSRAGTWNGVDFHKELSKFVENINEIGHEQHRPKMNDEAAPNEQPDNHGQNLDIENLLTDGCDILLLSEDVNDAGNDRPPSLNNLCEENQKVAVVMNDRIKLKGATDVDGNIVKDAATSLCNDVPFEGDDDLGDDIFLEIDELPKHNGDSHQKLSAVSTKNHMTAKQDLLRFGNEVSKSCSANDTGNNIEARKNNCFNNESVPKRSCQNGHRSAGNDTEFAGSGSPAGNYVHPVRFTKSDQRLPVNSTANVRELPTGSYTNGKGIPNRNNVNGQSLPQYDDANGKNLMAGFSAECKIGSSNCCTDGKGSLKTKAIHASNRASRSDAQSLSNGKIINPSIKPAPKNMLKSVVSGKTHFTLGKPQKMIDSGVDNRSEKSSETKERTVKQSLQRNVDEKEEKVENLEDSLDLDCLGDLSLDKEFEGCLADGKQNTGSKSKIKGVPGNQTSSSTKKQHKGEVKAEGVKNIDDIDIEEWEEDIFIDDDDLSSGVRNGIPGVTEAKGDKGVNIEPIDNGLDEFLSFTFDEEDCKIVNVRASTNGNRLDSIKKAVQSKENHKNGNGSCGNKVADNYVKSGEYDHINDMDCEFDDLDLSESCLQDLQVRNDCKDSNMRNANALYEGSETKFGKESVPCSAAGFRHNIRKDVVHKMSLMPGSSTNVGRVVDIRHMKRTHQDVAKKEYAVKSISSESFTNKVSDTKMRSNRNVEWDTKAAKKNSLRAESNFAATEVCFDKDSADNLNVMNFDFDDDNFALIDDEFDYLLKKENPVERITRVDEAKRPLSESSRKVSNCNSNFGQPKRSLKTDIASEVNNRERLEDKAEEFCADLADLLDDDFSEGCFDDLEQKADKFQPGKATIVNQYAIVGHSCGEISKHSSKNMTSVTKGINVISNPNRAASGGSSFFASNNCDKSTLGVPRMSLNVAERELKSTESAACASKAEASESATLGRSKFKFRRSAGIDFDTAAGSTKSNCNAKRPIVDKITNTKNVAQTPMLPSNSLTNDKHKNPVIRNKTSSELGNAQTLSNNACISKKSPGAETRNGMAIHDRKQIILTERPIQNAVGVDVSVIAKGSRSSGEFVALDADDDFWDDVEIDAKFQAKLPVTSTQKLDTGAKENENIDRSAVTQKCTMQDIEKKKAEAKRKLQQKMIKEKQDKALMRLMKNKR